MTAERVPPSPKPGTGVVDPRGDIRVIATETLFAPGQRELLLRHGGEEYRLRQTRNGKLILTK